MTERELFDAALTYEDPAERSAFLDRECGRDTRLRRHVGRLVASYPRLSGFLESPATGAATAALEATAQPGDMIGPYKLLQQVGEGGFGVVYMAEQQRPVRRKVAVKIIKPGMDSREVIARFEAERQALAVMDHPNIARVLDAGTTEAGRPYFVMDLVRGAPITDYCDQNKLTLEARLKLFVPVCRAIQHAHQKGIIHRDIKPSNVMITLADGGPTPKVIDFGVAKAIDHRLTDRTMFTKYGQIIGTLEYMSPEQAELGGMDIDTRSDVYSLGVLLYELLTGSTPLQRETLRGLAFDEVLRMIREVEPATPSDRISKSGEALAAISSQRCTEPRKLGLFVRGELDWIVMRSLEKSRSRRYASASELADDLDRFLCGEPVLACPPSWSYRLSKIVRKHVGLIASLALFLTVLVVTAPLSLWQAHRAMQAQVAARIERDDANRARDDANQSRDAEAKAKTELISAYEQLSAEQARTQDAHDRAIRNEAKLAAEKGHGLVEQGRTREGLLWLVRALNHAPPDETTLRQAILYNIAALWHDIPKPIAVLPREGELTKGASPASDSHDPPRWRTFLDPFGTRQLRVSTSGRAAELVDPATDQVLAQVELTEPGHLVPPTAGYGPFSSDGTVAALIQLPVTSNVEHGDPPSRVIYVHRWHSSSGAPVSEPKPLKLTGDWTRGVRLVLGPRAEHLFVSIAEPRTGQSAIQCYDVTQGETVDLAWNGGAGPSAGTISPNGLVLATITSQPRPWPTLLELWSLGPRRQHIGEIALRENIQRLCFESDGRHLLTQLSGSSVRWTVPETRLRQLLPQSGAIQSLASSRDGETLVAVGGRRVARWNLSTGERLLPDVELPIAANGGRPILALSADGNKLAAADGATVLRWDLKSGRPAGPHIHAPCAVLRLALDDTGNRLICACALDETKSEIHVYDTDSGAALRRPVPLLGVVMPGPRRGFSQGAMAIAPDGESILSTDKIVRLRTWDLGEPVPRAEMIDVKSGILTDARFTPDGQFVITCTNHQTIEVWDHALAARVGQPIHFQQPLQAYAVSPDGRVLATAVEGQIRFWLLQTGQSLGQALQQPNVTVMCFAGDGEQLCVGDEHGVIRVWQAFRHLPLADLGIPTIEAVTGLRLTDDGLIEPLDTAEWLTKIPRCAELVSKQMDHQRPETHLWQVAIEAQSAGDWQWARAAVETRVERTGDGMSCLLRARILLDEGRQDEAAAAFVTAIDRGPRDTVVAWLKQFARQETTHRRYARARWALDQIVAAGLIDADVGLAQAELCFAERQTESASAWLLRAIQCQPNSVFVVRRAGEIEFRLGRWEAALAHLTRALELGGGNDEVWRTRATCCAELGRWQQAAEDLGKAVQRHPRDSDLREQLAIALVSAGDLSGYGELCADTVANFDFADFQRRPWVAPSLLVLAPDGLNDYERFIKPAQDFADRYSGDCVSYHVLGPYCYRARQYDRSARATPPPNSMIAARVDELLFLAMANAQLGNLELARQKLADVDRAPWQQADVWQRQQIRLLLAEARLLVKD